MNAWLELVLATLAVAAGGVVGWWCSRLRPPWWAVGYAVPLGFIMSATVAWHLPNRLDFPPFTWALAGRCGYAGYGMASVILLASPMGRLPLRRERLAVLALLVVAGLAALWPFVARGLDQPHLARIATRMDGEGVCLQTTSYTCGPAAAVTLLRQMGLPAEEGRLAMAAKTSSFDGTLPILLARALEREYAGQGLRARSRGFRDLQELKSAGPTLAVLKLSFLIDHYVAVLEVTEEHVIVGDPLRGRETLTRKDFEDRWRYAGVEVTRGGSNAKD